MKRMYLCVCVCVWVWVRTYLATVQTTDRRRQTEVGRRQKSDNSAAFRATKFSNIFLVNLFFFYVLRVRVLFVPCVCVKPRRRVVRKRNLFGNLFSIYFRMFWFLLRILEDIIIFIWKRFDSYLVDACPVQHHYINTHTHTHCLHLIVNNQKVNWRLNLSKF